MGVEAGLGKSCHDALTFRSTIEKKNYIAFFHRGNRSFSNGYSGMGACQSAKRSFFFSLFPPQSYGSTWMLREDRFFFFV